MFCIIILCIYSLVAPGFWWSPEKAVLQGKGKVSRQDMEARVREELQRYQEQQKRLETGDS